MKKEEQNDIVDSFMCPSFSTYSSNNLAVLADQISRTHHLSDSLNDDNDNFEFLAFSNQLPSHHSNTPVFPIFNRDFVTDSDNTGAGSDAGGRNSGDDVDSPALQFSLKQLLISDEDICRETSSSSSSEVDELDGIPAGTYCVWTPKLAQSVQASPNKCKKSNSTGSSSESQAKRWKLLDLLRRSKSDGKRTLVWLKKKKKEDSKSESSKEERRRDYRNSDRENNNGNSNSKNKNKRRITYLEYKREEYMIGFAANLNAIGRAFAPF